MYIKRISVENWIGNRNLGKTLEEVNLEMVESSIRELDGKFKTLVSLETKGEAHMAIGGGESGIYVVYATFDNETFHNLIDSSKSDNIIEINAGGQYGEYPEKMCVSIDKALLAARIFAAEGKIEKTLEWEEN